MRLQLLACLARCSLAHQNAAVGHAMKLMPPRGVWFCAHSTSFNGAQSTRTRTHLWQFRLHLLAARGRRADVEPYRGLRRARTTSSCQVTASVGLAAAVRVRVAVWDRLCALADVHFLERVFQDIVRCNLSSPQECDQTDKYTTNVAITVPISCFSCAASRSRSSRFSRSSARTSLHKENMSRK